MKRTKVVLIGTLISMLMSSCGNVYDYSKIPQEPVLTKQEVIDYYANQMSYDSITQRTAVKKSTIQWNPVPDNIQAKLWEQTARIIETHQLNRGFEDDMSFDVHDWLKLNLDGLVLDKPAGGNFTYTEAESQGFYFVTVDFSTKLNGLGTMKDEANYLGIDGIITENAGEVKIDTNYLPVVLRKVNLDRLAKGLKPYNTFGTELNLAQSVKEEEVETLPETDADGNKIIADENGNAAVIETSEAGGEVETSEAETSEAVEKETTESVESNESLVENETNSVELEFDDNKESGESVENEVSNTDSDNPYNNSYANEVRQLEYDVKYVNDLVGSSALSMAAVPHSSMLYNPVEPTGELSGYGMFSEGDYGLKDFGYDRAKYPGGTMKITFVFKQNADERNKFDYSYCYINEYNSGITMEDSDITLSEYINSAIDQTIERADRAYSNCDVTALMSKEIYEASDLGLKLALQRNSTNILNYMTKRIKTLQRNPSDDREYLVELEKTIEEAPKGFGNTGRYKDKYYAVIRQEGQTFKINDLVWVSRTLERIPDPDVDTSTTRRLTSLNLSGDVSEQAKSEITEMLKRFYYSSTNRILYDQKQDGSIIIKDNIYQYGLISRFDSDKELLNQSKFDYLTSQVIGRLTRHTANVPCKLTGQVTEWLGGYNDQVELTTEELYSYGNGLNSGIYVKNYYLVSHYGTEWVIDDVVIIEEKEVNGAEFEGYYNQLGNIDTTPTLK